MMTIIKEDGSAEVRHVTTGSFSGDGSDGVHHVTIGYFSGTGSTLRVAKCFEACFHSRGISCRLVPVSTRDMADVPEDMLVVIYAVHALNAPEPVYRWLDSLPAVQGRPAAVISVSGGGEVFPNTACRVSTIRRLEKKGYAVNLETMLVMPSNFAAPTPEAYAVRLLELLPKKVERAVSALLSGTRRRAKPSVCDRFLSKVGEIEKFGGTSVRKNDPLRSGLHRLRPVRRKCPAANITIMNGRPVFGSHCSFCLGCLYGCPLKALQPGIMKSILLKDGYSMQDFERKAVLHTKERADDVPRRKAWAGVRKYINEDDDLSASS